LKFEVILNLGRKDELMIEIRLLEKTALTSWVKQILFDIS